MGPPTLDPAVVARAYARAAAHRWTLTPSYFAEALTASVVHGCSDQPTADEVERYIGALHLEDLALAAACAEGIEAAWDQFIRTYRPLLYRAADGIDPSGGAREVADALYADLFGLDAREGVRRSLFRHFHGRSQLTTWLRAVLAQRYVDTLRTRRRLEPLPDEDRADPRPVPQDSPPPDAAPLIERVLSATVASLGGRDRLRLTLYYVRDLTLAQIGRLLREHEGTVSRHLTRTRQALREGMIRRLREEHGLDEAAIGACFQAVVDDAGTLDLGRVLGDAAPASLVGGKNALPDRSE